MASFPRGHHSALPPRHVTYRERLEQAKALAQAAVEAGGNVKAERRRMHANTPADAITLRGIPCAARGVPGVIRHTQPETEATR